MTTPIFQQGEQVIRRGEATRYYKGKTGWSNTSGMLYLTNQRIVHVAGFGNQRNWPLDHIVKVQTGLIDTVNTVTIEFDNGMVEWFALDEQNTWIKAIQSAAPRRATTLRSIPVPAEASDPVSQRAASSNRRLLMWAVAAMGAGALLCLCAVIAAAMLYFLPVTNFTG